MGAARDGDGVLLLDELHVLRVQRISLDALELHRNTFAAVVDVVVSDDREVVAGVAELRRLREVIVVGEGAH